MKKSIRIFIIALVPAAAVWAVYGPALLEHDFVWDDRSFLYDSPVYRAADSWLEVLRRPFEISPNYFRPLVILTYLAELRFWGLNPTPLHYTNLLIHALNATWVTLLALSLGIRQRNQKLLSDASVSIPQEPLKNRAPKGLGAAAIGIGLLYGLHPALLEGVVFISSRFDLLFAFFTLTALLADTVFEKHKWVRAGGVALAFFLAALCKEMAVTFPVILVLWHLATGRFHGLPERERAESSPIKLQRKIVPLHSSWKIDAGIIYGAVFLMGVVYLVIRYAGMGYLLRPGISHIAQGTPLQHLLLIARSIMEYGILVFWPFSTLTPIHYASLPLPLSDPLAWFAVGMLMCLCMGMVWLLRSRPLSGWLLVMGCVVLLPVINIIPLNLLGGAFVAERFLLLPLAFFTLAMLPLWRVLTSSSPSLSLRMGGIASLLLWFGASVVSIQKVLPHWRTSLTLWSWVATRAPDSSLPYINLTEAYNNQGDYDAAIATAQEAVNRAPEDAMGWNNLGRAYFYTDRLPEALKAFEKAMTLEPHTALFQSNIGAILLAMNRLTEAEAILKQALALDVNHGRAQANLGVIYAEWGESDLACAHLLRAQRLLPPNARHLADKRLAEFVDPGPWLNGGDLLSKQGHVEDALHAFDEAAKRGAPAVNVALGKSAVFLQLKRYESAKRVLETALPQAKEDARIYNNLGVAAVGLKKDELARSYFEKAVTLRPDWALPRESLSRLEERRRK